MEKLSVKKPFTILVAVIAVLVLGVVSVTRMTMDLLPDISLSYLMVVTPYPGASPERVEEDVVRPMESALGTITGVENVFSTSAENYGMVQLEFADGTDMDAVMVKVTSALQTVTASLPELCGTPSIIELSMDMVASMYVSVSRDNYDIYQLSSFIENTVQPYLERQNGVASISGIGLVEQSIHVQLDKDKIDKLNDRILATVNDKLAQAMKELDKAEAEVAKGKEELNKAQASFGQTMADTIFGQIDTTVNATAEQLKEKVDALLKAVQSMKDSMGDSEMGTALDTIIENLENISQRLEDDNLSLEDLISITGSLQVIAENLSDILRQTENTLTPEKLAQLRQELNNVESALQGLSSLLDSVPQMLSGIKDAYAGMTQAQLEAAVGFATASSQLTSAEAQLVTAKTQYETAREQALANANLGKLLNVSTLSQLIYAQNFSMPAGYIDDANDQSWLLKVGEEYDSVEDISGSLLASMEGIGDVRLSDVATVTVLDNAMDSYTRLNGQQAVILSIYKSSTVGTNEMGKNCLAAFDELENKYSGTHVVTLMNQGNYIDLIVDTVLSSMVLGGILAIIILALFLKDVKPTLVVAVSIPLSVLFALVLMYFTGLTLNMMTLSGLALGIGMLVDNSIVVIENIYRLRSRGVSAPRAAVQGTKQVAGAIISSTLTTICVFLPLVFTEGLVKELLLPLGLCIGYCLIASLIVALTVVPASASTLLRNNAQKSHPWFDKIHTVYGKFLNWCLDHKAAPIGVSVGLLALCVVIVLNTGIVLLPEMNADSVQVTISTPDELSREESYEMADGIVSTILQVDGVREVGVMDGSSAMGMMGGLSMGGGGYGSYTCFVVLEDDTPSSKVSAIVDQINDACKEHAAEVEATASGMDEMTAALGSGLSIKIFGEDSDTMLEISKEIVDIVSTVEGYTDIGASAAQGAPALHLVIDKDKAMAKGLTVAQVFMTISEKLTTSATSTTVTVDGIAMDITVENNTAPLTVENLLELELTGTSMDDKGNSVSVPCKLSEFATVEEIFSMTSIDRENQSRYVTVSADIKAGYNATLLSRTLSEKLKGYTSGELVPYGYSVSLEGESSTVNEMVSQMALLLALGCLLIYLVMVAQFQSLLSPFIVLFTVPLAFTGGMLGLLIAGHQLSLLSLMGFAVLMGTIVNNGIVFVDYVNQLRIGGLDRRNALIAAGITRMRPILMTALTTILAMFQMVFSDDMAGQLGGGMAVVIIGGLIYGTLMTLIVIPVIYDILSKRPPKVVDIGGENLDDVPDDAAEYLEKIASQESPEQTNE